MLTRLCLNENKIHTLVSKIVSEVMQTKNYGSQSDNGVSSSANFFLYFKKNDRCQQQNESDYKSYLSSHTWHEIFGKMT